ncbi:HNH endonuclease [Metabacillus sp. RGM 3146]|uniref:HNH endonuclease n=1 Tax=Metabacillus sp. RGM 3146 TaxID=3401092 RepID=UPI003B9BB3EC
MNDSSAKRKKRLEDRTILLPETYQVSTRVFKRNPDVLTEVLLRANGICEKCQKRALFKRKSDGLPYLEVHHTERLDGGEDTVENAVAVCPNCLWIN